MVHGTFGLRVAGPARSVAPFCHLRFAAFIERRPELIHIRTRRKSPNQNGVRERAFGSLKYEHLYRLEIDDGHQLGQEVDLGPGRLHGPYAEEDVRHLRRQGLSVLRR